MYSRIGIPVIVLLAVTAHAQNADRMRSPTQPVTTIGPRNPPLYEGARALLAGRNEEGVRLTHEGLEMAQGAREHDAALSNLCAGYIRLNQLDLAMKYCDLLLARNENSWRGYNNRAIIYIEREEYDKADADLSRAEQINPGAHTLKVARAMYMDAVHPVRTEVEIDDRRGRGEADRNERL